MALSVQAPFVSVLVWPINHQASNRTPWTISENYAGCFQAGGDGGAEDSEGIAEFKSLQFPNLPAFIDLKGPIDFVRFTSAGRVERGVPAALQANPNNELCGLTVQLRRERRANVMAQEPNQSKAPTIDTTLLPLQWTAEEGEWETVAPARTPIETSVQPYGLVPNKTFKIKTSSPWDADRGFIAFWDYQGVTYDHKGEPAVRLMWGETWSLLFHGLGDKSRPSLERRDNGDWQCVRVLRDCAPLDQKFWNSSHTVRVQRIGGRLCIDVDGVEYGLLETKEQGDSRRSVQTSWRQAPLRVWVWGANVMVRVHSLTGDSPTPSKDGTPSPLQVSFKRLVPAPGKPPFGESQLAFKVSGSDASTDASPSANGASGQQGAEGQQGDSGQSGDSTSIKTQLLGSDLDMVRVEGRWENDIASYDAVLECTSTTAPLVSGFVTEFAPLFTQSLADAIEIRPAVTSLSIDSGDPENLPDSEAELSLSYPLLKRLVPHWEDVILPFRPILIRAKYPSLENDEASWTTLFRGYLTPESRSRDQWNDKQIPLTARGPLVRLSEPAALVDERFAPLDLQMSAGKTSLWGAEAVKNLLTVELGPDWTNNFNGTEEGNPFRYLPEGHYPLLSKEIGYFDAIQAPKSGTWRFPPPFGDDLKSWIDSLAKYDYAVWFFDASSDAFFYGRLTELLIERGRKPWVVPENASSPSVTITGEPRILSSLQQSGLLEQAFNDIRVWGAAPEGGESLTPSFIMGRAGDSDPNSQDPISVAQSWRRTRLEKPDYAKQGVIDSDVANAIAFSIWQEYKGRPPVRMEAQFETGFLGPRWGEILHLPTGFAGPKDGGQDEYWRILRVKHAFDFSGSGNRFSTTITTRTISANGQ